MTALEIAALFAAQTGSGKAYLEFLRIPALSMGLYVLPAGGTDPQQPHTEDEVYYILRGRAVIRVADEDRPVQVGSVIMVEAGIAHHFHSIAEELAVLVFFAPAEYSRGAQGAPS